jgi:hypothetical protein
MNVGEWNTTETIELPLTYDKVYINSTSSPEEMAS